MATDGKQHDELFLIDGNSLAYRAFFALPESIATSTGFPTNAIFGFASMLVKMLTEYGSKPTVVVWDAGCRAARRSRPTTRRRGPSRPDLLKEQWPHLEPLVEAFGYRNVQVEGFEADDVIASIAERARDENVPVMVVTGDRDAFQIIDPDSRVRVMATGRGITDTKIYDHAAVIERYGITPDLIPDFYGLKGDTSDNIPGVPGIGDKTASQLLQQFGVARGRPRPHRRHLGRQAQAEPHRARRRRAVSARCSRRSSATSPSRSTRSPRPRARPTARSCARSSASSSCARRSGASRRRSATTTTAAPAPVAEQTITARVRAGTLADVAALGVDAEVAVAVRAPAPPEGELFAETETWRFAVATGDRVLVGPCDGPEELVAALGDRPVIAHDAKALAVVPRNLVHDTLLAAYLLEPARRGLPVPRDLRGARARVRRRRPGRRRGGPDRRRSPRGSASSSTTAA